MPAVAVIVPVFNRFDLLQATVASLRAQTLRNAEFILVDDRSDDDVVRFLLTLPSLDDRFRIIRKPDEIPRGCQISRNLGFAAARADAIIFLDSDDLLAPSCLEDRLNALSADPAADMIVGRQAIFRESDHDLRWVNLQRAGEPDLERFLRLGGPLDVPWVNGGVMIRAGRLRDSGVKWRPEFHWDDVAFHFECLVSGLVASWMALGVPADFYYREHSEERFGRALFSREGIRTSARMIVWMSQLLIGKAAWNEERRRALVTSLFHACVLRAIDQHQDEVASDVITEAASEGLLSQTEKRRLHTYHAGRQLLTKSARLTYYWNRLARWAIIATFFADTSGPQTYGTGVLQSPQARPALEELLDATSPARTRKLPSGPSSS